jgi:SAM-dependent methyltransferase
MVGQDGAVTEVPEDYRLYADLAEWWPLISPPGEYQAEAAYLAAVLQSAAAGPGPARVLDLGSGGGHNAVHLAAAGLRLTLVDLSATMLEVSRQLNPGAAHHQGDIRTIRLGHQFDAVLVHDAVDYMTSQDDLRQVIGTAYAHCRPGGLAVFVPDYTADSFRPATGHGGGSRDPSGRQASFREQTSDPDASDDWIQVDYEFWLRGADGTEQVVHETHRLGAFRHATWLELLAGAGFSGPPEPGVRPPEGAQRPRNLFVARRPA